MAGEASPGEFSLAGGLFLVVTIYKSGRPLLSDSVGAVSMFSPTVNWTFLLKKKPQEKFGRVSQPAGIFHIKISGLLPNQLKTYPFPFKEKKKIPFILFFYLSLWIRISHLRFKKVGFCFCFFTTTCPTHENFGELLFFESAALSYLAFDEAHWKGRLLRSGLSSRWLALFPVKLTLPFVKTFFPQGTRNLRLLRYLYCPVFVLE